MSGSVQVLTCVIAVFATSCSASYPGSEPAEPETPRVDAPGGFALDAPTELSFRIGESGEVDVRVLRERGFSEAVAISVQGLPGGAAATSDVIEPWEEQGVVRITASSDASPDAAAIRLIGVSTSGIHEEFHLELQLAGTSGSLDDTYDAELPSALADVRDFEMNPDGSLVLTGDDGDPAGPPVCALNGDGTARTTFGEGGCVQIPLGQPGLGVDLATVGGKLIVAGQLGSDSIFVARLQLASGEMDGTFGIAGITIVDLPKDGRLRSMLVLQNAILLAGGEGDGADRSAFIVRVLEDGEVDTAFGVDGWLRFGGTDCVDLAATAADRFIAATANFLWSFEADGAPDPGFGAGGQVSLPIPVSTIAVELDGDVLAVGREDMALLRVSESGQLLSIHAGPDAMSALAYDVEIGADGAIIVSGSIAIGTNYFIGVTRRRPDGELDTTFGSHGVQILQRGSRGRRVAIGGEHGTHYTIAGTANLNDAVIVRIWE